MTDYWIPGIAFVFCVAVFVFYAVTLLRWARRDDAQRPVWIAARHAEWVAEQDGERDE